MLREGKPLQKTSGPPGWGLGVGLTTPPLKNYQVTETATINSNLLGPMEISSQAPEFGTMTAPSENPSREAMNSRRSFLGPKSMVRLNLVIWACHEERHRQLRKTRPGGKETLLRPYAPLRAIRTDDDDDTS